MNVESERRAAPRAAVRLDLRLERGHGRPIAARTLDLAPSGTLIDCERPLGIDELLEFDLELDGSGRHVRGDARVLRQRTDHVYALRFEHLSGETRAELTRFVERELASG
jgi:hypothetical protein